MFDNKMCLRNIEYTEKYLDMVVEYENKFVKTNVFKGVDDEIY